MRDATTTAVARQIESLFAVGSAAGLSDRQLLDRFAAGHDQAAFAAIVARHGPMVLTVCRQLLGDPHHAEDAFQAVFLVLARRAGSLRDPDSLGGWLHGVALRTARKARERVARSRRADEARAADRPEACPASAEQAAVEQEEALALHAEVERLPSASRRAVVLCYFEGLSLAEAADRLRCPVGTIHSRLARAREKLRHGLARRGVLLSTAALDARPSPVTIPIPLCDATARAAVAFAGPASDLAREVLMSMLIHRLRIAAAVLLLGVAAGAGSLAAGRPSVPGVARSGDLDTTPGAVATALAGPQVSRIAGATRPDPDTPRMTVAGRVLDPDGKPMPGAAVMAIVRSKTSERPMLELPSGPMTAHDGRCDASGHFRIELPRTSSARDDGIVVMALAPGYGIGWAELDPDAEAPAADVVLRPEQVIRGRLFDTNGQPARGVALRIRTIHSAAVNGSLPTIVRPDMAEFRWRDSPAWPGPAISDDDGRFVLRGLGRGLRCTLMLDDPRFSLQNTVIQMDEDFDTGRLRVDIPTIKIDPGPDPKPIAIALQPARTVTGRVTYAETGRPVPHALVTSSSKHHEADAEGRYRMAIEPLTNGGDRFIVHAQSPDGAPYLRATKSGEWPRGAVEQSIDLAVPRGIVVRGKVAEEGTGRPVAGAIVRLSPSNLPGADPGLYGAPAVTAADGTYRIAGPPAPAYLIVQAASDDYVLREFAGGRFQPFGTRTRERRYAHAYREVELKLEDPGSEADFTLRPGAAVHGRIVGPDGQPVRDASVFSRLSVRSLTLGQWKTDDFRNDRGRRYARDGRFAIHGLEPDAEIAAYVLDPVRKLGATARLSARAAAGDPATIRLEPCGSARGRLVDPDGRPLARYPAISLVRLVLIPGPPRDRPTKEGPPFAMEAFLPHLDPLNYPDDLRSDPDGRLAWPALIPGAGYRVVDQTAVQAGGERAVRKEFTVRPGESLDLGDIRIEKPR